MFFIFAALLTVIIGVNNTPEATELTASAGSYSSGSGLWPNTIAEPGTYWLNSYCNTNWYMYMSDGDSGDNDSSSSQCEVDQGSSFSSRNCYHQIRVPFGSELTSNMAWQSFTFTFSGEMHAANPDYNTIRLYLEFLNSSGTVIASTGAAVWGDDGGGGSTDVFSYEYITYDTNNLSGCTSLRITVRDDKSSGASLRDMDLFLRNHRLVITCNTSLYNAGYVNYGSQVTDITDGHLIATTGTMSCNGVTKYGWQATGVSNDNPRITLSASSMPVAAGVTYTMTAFITLPQVPLTTFICTLEALRDIPKEMCICGRLSTVLIS